MSGGGDTEQDLHTKAADENLKEDTIVNTGSSEKNNAGDKLEQSNESSQEKYDTPQFSQNKNPSVPDINEGGRSQVNSTIDNSDQFDDTNEDSESVVKDVGEQGIGDIEQTMVEKTEVSEQSYDVATEQRRDNEPEMLEQLATKQPEVLQQSATEKAEEQKVIHVEANAEEKSNVLEKNGDEKAMEENADERETTKEDEYLDILGNGTLLKKVLEAGSGNRPNMGDEVIVVLLQEIPELDKVLPEERLQYVLGDGDVAQALDLVVALMNVGEKASVIAGFKYMYGELGLEPDIPPKSNFKLTVELKENNGPLDFQAMNFTTRFAHAKKKKDRGNDLVKRKDYFRALNLYTKAGKIVDPNLGCIYEDETAENLQELLEFRATVLSNSSLANFRLEAYEAALKAAKEACSLWPSYSKGFFRMALAQEKLGNVDEAIRSYKNVLKHDTGNAKFIHQELERLSKLRKDGKRKEQEMYSKMFWGSNPPGEAKPAVKPTETLRSWLWKTGATVAGAGAVGLAGIGVYKYLNH